MMDWSHDPNTGHKLTAPDDADTWAKLQPYLAAGWAKLLAAVPATEPKVTLCIDGRMGGGNIWMVIPGHVVHLDLPGVEALVSGADDPDEANCRFATEVLKAVTVEPAKAAAEAVAKAYPKAAVSHDAIDPEHGWYKPFKTTLAKLLAGKRPKIAFTYDFDMDEE